MVVAGDMEVFSFVTIDPIEGTRTINSYDRWDGLERSHMLICMKWADWLILLKNSPRPADEQVARFQPLPRPSCIRRGLGTWGPLQEYTEDQLFFTTHNE